jgi:hypothetical protein
MEDLRPDAAGAAKCPHCGATLRLKARAPRATPAPAPEPVEELVGADVVDDDPPDDDEPTPRRRKKKRRGGKKDKKSAGILRHVPLLSIVGGVVIVAGVVITLVIALGSKGGGDGPGGGLGGTGAVVSSPVPPLPPPNRPAPAPLPKKARAAAAPRVAGKPTLWTARPDPPAKPAEALAPYGADVKGEFVFASLDGPFLIHLASLYEGNVYRPKVPGRPDSPIIDNPLPPQPVIDLRTGKKAGEFHYKAPTWRGGRLAPDGQTIVGPDTSPKGDATPKDGQLFVWKQGADQPAARSAVGRSSGPISSAPTASPPPSSRKPRTAGPRCESGTSPPVRPCILWPWSRRTWRPGTTSTRTSRPRSSATSTRQSASSQPR